MIQTETAIRELNRRGYVIEVCQTSDFMFTIRLAIICTDSVQLVYENDHHDLASGLVECIKWLDRPSEANDACRERAEQTKASGWNWNDGTPEDGPAQ